MSSTAPPTPSATPPPPPPFFGLTPEQLAALPHDDLGPRLNMVMWVLFFFATSFLGLRVYCKWSKRGGLWWDDYVLITSWVFLGVTNSISSVQITMGYGMHIWDFPLKGLFRLPLLANVGGTFSVLAAVYSKTSFAITLLRITQGWTKMVVWWGIISMNIAMHLTALLLWIQCAPVEKAWNPLIEGSCYPINRLVEYNMFSASYSAVMDVMLALLPWKIIWAAQLGRNEKLGVAVAMSMGLFAGITAFIKVTRIPRMKSGDIYDGVELVMWSTAEISITIMAASVPVLRALLGERKSSKKNGERGPPKYRLDSSDNFELQSRSTCIIEAGPGSLRVGSTTGSGHKKEDSIFKLSAAEKPPPPASGAIVRTSIVTVQYEDTDQKAKAAAETDAKAPPMSPSECPDIPLTPNWPLPKTRLSGIPDKEEV